MDGGGRSRCVIMRCFGIRWSHVRPLGGAASSCDDDEISRGASAHGGTGIVRVLGPGPWSSAVSGVDRGQHLVVRTSARQRSTPRRSHQRPTAFNTSSFAPAPDSVQHLVVRTSARQRSGCAVSHAYTSHLCSMQYKGNLSEYLNPTRLGNRGKTFPAYCFDCGL
jgi:hypothetical protein